MNRSLAITLDKALLIASVEAGRALLNDHVQIGTIG